MGELQWILKTQDTARAAQLARALGVSPLLAQLMINRGITDPEAARLYLEGDLTMLADPFLMADMARAVERIEQALTTGEPIVIYGDYDVDGQTATALLVSVFRELSNAPEKVSFYIPNRMDEGYGLNSDALRFLSTKTKLVITVDCGIASLKEAELARELGIDLIITDHHQPGDELPRAYAVINPKRSDCLYPEKNLSGVGIAFRVAQAVGSGRGRDFHEYLDLVALGTVADIVPLLGENRIIVKQGLKEMSTAPRCGVAALLEVSGVSGQVRASDLGFRLGPRLNAAGRMSDPDIAVRLLLTEDPDLARELAVKLDGENAHRQDVERRIVKEATELILASGMEQNAGIVVAGAGWHPGVIGIVASRLVEEFYRPTIVVSLADGVGTGSARSIAGFSMYEGLKECSHLLERFGGHTMAAGLTVTAENLPAFADKFAQVCAERLTPDMLLPKLAIDAEVSLCDITEELVRELALLEPTGMGNPAPMLKVEGSIVDWRIVGRQGNHLTFTMRDHHHEERRAIAFGLAEQAGGLVSCQENAAVAFVPVINEWREERTVQLQVRALARAGERSDFISRVMETYPWQLSPDYYLSSYLKKAVANLENKPSYEPAQIRISDLRGVWNKLEALRERVSRGTSLLLLVHSAAEAQELCRELRIAFPERRDRIGFIHEHLKPSEVEELERTELDWVVSTSTEWSLDRSWDMVWLWRPPLTAGHFQTWMQHVQGSEVALVFGHQDVREVEYSLSQILPDRRGLARIYSLLRQGAEGGVIELQRASALLAEFGLDRGLWFAAQIFQELKLWRVDEATVAFLPEPAQKLDLHQAVLYNRGMNIRRQSSLYLKECLQRGFKDHGFKTEN